MSVFFACDTIKVPFFAVVFQKSLCKQYRNGWLFDSYVKLKPAFELRKIYTEIKTDSVLSHFQKNKKTPKNQLIRIVQFVTIYKAMTVYDIHCNVETKWNYIYEQSVLALTKTLRNWKPI